MRASARSTSKRARHAGAWSRSSARRELTQWTTPLRMAPPIEGLQPVEITTLPIDKVRFQRRSGRLHRRHRPLSRRRRRRAGRTIDYDVLPSGARAMPPRSRAGAPLVDDSAAEQSGLASEFYGRRLPARMLRRSRRSWSRRRFAASPDPCADRDARLPAPSGTRAGEHLTMHIGNQVPHPLRTQLAGAPAADRIAGHGDLARMSAAASARRSRSIARN